MVHSCILRKSKLLAQDQNNVLIIGIVLSLIGFFFEFKSKPNQQNGQEEIEPSSKEIDELENKTRRLLEGPLKEKTEKCLKRLLDEYQ